MTCRMRGRARLAVVFAALASAVSACGDDGPSGPSEDFDIVGAWQWRVTDASGNGSTCTVSDVTLTFARNEGVLTGTRFSSGGGNITCSGPSGTTTSNFITNTSIKQLVHAGTSISFEFDTSTGAWVMAGSVTGDNSMGGDATIRLGLSTGGSVALSGSWTATRN